MSVLESLPCLAWACRLDGSVEYVNQRWIDYTGSPLATSPSFRWQSVVHPDDWESAKEVWAAALRDGTEFEAPLRLRRADGVYRWFHARGAPMRDEGGVLTGYSGVSVEADQELSELRRAKALADERRAQLEAVYSSMADSVTVFDMNKQLVLANPASARMFASSEHDTRRAKDAAGFVQIYELLDLEGRALPIEEWPGSRIHRGESISDLELRLRRRDTGVEWIVSFSGHPVRDATGKQILTLLISRDVTERKRAEQALIESNERKAEFLAMLSHELRNPLASINNSVFLLERTEPGSDTARRAHAVIARQARHMTRLVDDLLDVSRISRGKIALQREPVELNALARSTVDDHRASFERSGVDLELLEAPQPLWVSGDRTRLAQILGNLLSNAAKFTPRNGRTVVSLGREGDRANLVVQDTGGGIAPEVREWVFEPFTQAETSLARSRGGLGLGLALVKGLVETHGGTVSADNDVSQRGARFKVALPLDVAAEQQAVAARAFSHRHSRPRRVLVIEDDPDAAESLKQVLEFGEHRVAVASDGPEGVALARTFEPDVVLCDIGLPGMDGFAVARTMSSDPELRSAYLVALSGYTQPEDRAKSQRAGFARHLAKPPDLDALEKLLDEAPERPHTG